MCDTVVFATDLSPASDRVVACLHGLRQLGTERLLLTHALGIRHLDDLKHQLGPLAEHKLNEQKAVLEKQRFTVEVVIAPGVPSWEINSVARDRHASMIVIAPRGVPAAREALLGRVAFGVAHRAEVPVLMAQLKITEDENRCEAISGDLLLHVLFPTDFSEVAERAYAYLEDLVRTGCRRVSLMHVQD